ncbi:hypothetical protein HCT46_02580 [Spirochaetales bacterium BR208]|uniref:Uncharacterized protein n=2 Tax=Entomospira nematocerorum TaxID=2719987 RepID=A0A968GGP6_9SPIO|nr:hypothetical protein [Entomospira nematocera]NIZ46806.1 hypothetical protein [Entomospira nematocera]
MVPRYHVITLIILLTMHLHISAREEIAQDITFNPPHFYVGDEVHMTFWIPRKHNEYIESGLYPQYPNLLIHEIEFLPHEQKTYISLRFTSFSVGKQLLSLQLGDVVIADLPILTQSLVREGNEQARTIYGPLLLEKTQLFFILLTAVFLLITPMVLLTRWSLKRLYQYYITSKQQPYRLFIRTIMQLIRTESQLSDAQYYSQLTLAIRSYLTAQFTLASLHSTTPQEMESVLRPYFEKEIILEFTALLQRSDAIRFGGRFTEQGERQSDTNFILSLAKTAEKQQTESAT